MTVVLTDLLLHCVDGMTRLRVLYEVVVEEDCDGEVIEHFLSQLSLPDESEDTSDCLHHHYYQQEEGVLEM